MYPQQFDHVMMQFWNQLREHAEIKIDIDLIFYNYSKKRAGPFSQWKEKKTHKSMKKHKCVNFQTGAIPAGSFSWKFDA